jgi:hypothetical protein
MSKGFWKDPRHLANQFAYLTGSPPLTKIVEENIVTQFGLYYKYSCYKLSEMSQFTGHLEVFLRDQVKTVEFKDHFENIERICQVDNNGSSTLKDIHLLVCKTIQ